MNTKALRQFSYGVYLVTARGEDGRATGCVVNTGMQLTSDPYRVMVAVNVDNATCGAIRHAGRFALTTLTTQADMGLIGTFGFHSSTDVDKFADRDVRETAHGVPYVADAAGAVVDCRVTDELELGTHVVFVGAVEDAEVFDAAAEPLTYAYYHGVLKGTTPPKASAFIAEDDPAEATAASEDTAAGGAQTRGDEEKETAMSDEKAEGAQPQLHHFRCNLCGYVYETTDEELSEDFHCPLCGAAASMFTKVD